MKVKTILDELKKGEKFSTEGKVVFTKPVRQFNSSKGPFYTQFILLQDDSTGFTQQDEKLPIAVTVHGPNDSIERLSELKIDGVIDEHNGVLQYKGRIKDRIINVGNSKKDAIQEQINKLMEQMNEPEEKPVEPEKKVRKVNPEEPARIARSVAVKAAVDLVLGEAIPPEDFWNKCYEIEDYVLNGPQEQIETVDDSPDGDGPVPF